MRRTLAPSKKTTDNNIKVARIDLITNINVAVEDKKVENPHKYDDIAYYTVAYGKPSKKKHKTWDGDGFLSVSDRNVTLYDSDHKEMGSTLKKQLSKIVFEEGATLYVGGKYVEIIAALTQRPDQTNENKVPTNCDSPRVSSFINKEFRPVCQNVTSTLSLKATDALKPIIFPRPSANHIFRYNQSGAIVRDVILDAAIASRMRPHQIDGVVFLYECVVGLRAHKGMGAILADAMGLGKSVQSIALVWTLLKQGPYDNEPLIRRCLIVCPSSLVLNWKAEFDKWLGARRLQPYFVSGECRIEKYLEAPSTPVLVLSYEMMTKHQVPIRHLQFDLIICDEAHRLKNSAIKASLGVESLSIPRRVLLTGTPLQNDMDELYALSDFCNPGILGDTKDIFRKRFVDPISSSRDPSSSRDQIDRGTDASLELQRITRSYMLRRTETVNIEYLPPKDELILFCRPTDMQLIIYRILLSSKSVRAQLGDDNEEEEGAEDEEETAWSNGGDALTCILLLRKLCNDPSLFLTHIIAKSNGAEHNQAGSDSSIYSEVHRELSVLAHTSPAWRDILSGSGDSEFAEIHSGKLWVTAQMLLAMAPTEKMVLASHFTKTLDLLQNLCTRLALKTLRIDGSTSAPVRMKIVNEFNDQRRVCGEILLLSCKAGGEGLNLVGASRILLYDLDWNPATDAQTLARVWRDGQTSRVAVYRLVTAGTVEESLLQRQVAKQQLTNACVDRTNKSNVSVGFSSHELKDIFALHDEHITESGSWTHHLLDCDCHTSKDPDIASSSGVPVTPPRLHVNPLCQLGLARTPTNSRSFSTIAQLRSWTHWVGPAAIESHCTDSIVLNAVPQLTSVFHKRFCAEEK